MKILVLNAGLINNIIVKTPKYVYIALLKVVFILYKLFILKDSFSKKAGYFLSMSRVPGVGNCLFLHAQRWEIEHQLEKKLQIFGGVPGRGGGGDGNSEVKYS